MATGAGTIPRRAPRRARRRGRAKSEANRGRQRRGKGELQFREESEGSHLAAASDASKPDRTTPLRSTEQPTPVRSGEAGRHDNRARAGPLSRRDADRQSRRYHSARASRCCVAPTGSFARTPGSPQSCSPDTGSRTPLETYHDHNAEQARPAILAALRRGERVALVGDAGTPLVSDPGYKLVRAAIAENLPVTAVPGASAALAGLILSGLPPDSFLFAGFLPPRQTARRRELRVGGIRGDPDFYEARSGSPLPRRHSSGPRRPAGGGRARADQAARGSRARSLQELADYYRDTGRRAARRSSLSVRPSRRAGRGGRRGRSAIGARRARRSRCRGKDRRRKPACRATSSTGARWRFAGDKPMKGGRQVALRRRRRARPPRPPRGMAVPVAFAAARLAHRRAEVGGAPPARSISSLAAARVLAVIEVKARSEAALLPRRCCRARSGGSPVPPRHSCCRARISPSSACNSI